VSLEFVERGFDFFSALVIECRQFVGRRQFAGEVCGDHRLAEWIGDSADARIKTGRGFIVRRF